MNEYRADRSLSTVSNIIPLPNENINPIRDHLQCPLCIFTASSRPEFTEHLIGHYTPKQRNNINSLKAVLAHLPAFKSLLNSDSDSCLSFTLSTERETEELDKSSSFRASAANPQNKSLSSVSVRDRGFRKVKSCKQCNFIARTKMEYWEHMRYHIKGFTCSECSFVTKYKHHMNHHWLSVHDGSKPFKCKRCLYTCVSKSMLTSHLKKHSNVYPYRCADCAYKTKFCNALKKHLRKMEHQPAMVLNADGSPNPLTVIDIYGTKRGPKQQKPAPVRERDETESTVATTSSTDDHLTSAVSTTSPLSPSFSLRSSVARYLNVTAINGVNDGHWINQNVGVNMNHAVATFPYSDLVAAFNLSSHISLREDAKTPFCENVRKTDYADGTTGTTLMESAKISNTEDKMTEMFAQSLPVTNFDAINNVIGKYHQSSDSTEATSKSSTTFMAIESTQLKYQRAESGRADVPLDLRIAEVIGKKQLQLQTLTRISANSPKVTGTSKRKGKAIKLERRYGTMVKAMGSSTDDDQELKRKWEGVSFESLSIESRAGSSLRQGNQRIKDIKDEAVVDLFDAELTCHYCEIIFGNVIMYVVHMGCHNFHDPYTCSICGQRCIDKLSFFLHIARSEH